MARRELCEGGMSVKCSMSKMFVKKTLHQGMASWVSPTSPRSA